MGINIINAQLGHLDACYDALINSEIGDVYFKSFDSKRMLARGIGAGEIEVAVDDKDEVLGFIWCEDSGTFGAHAFLHIIAVAQQHRNKGVGRALIKNYEEKVFKEDDKIFLMVAEFNTNAKRLYERLGYVQVGLLPEFYRRGVNECLMMKKK